MIDSAPWSSMASSMASAMSRQRLVPGDRLELSLAPLADPLERLGHAVGRVVAVAPAGALLAAHRVHVGDSGLGRGPQGRLLLADDLVVLGVDAEGTAARVAVHRVAAPGHLVPGPLLAIPIRPCCQKFPPPPISSTGPEPHSPAPRRPGTIDAGLLPDRSATPSNRVRVLLSERTGRVVLPSLYAGSGRAAV